MHHHFVGCNAKLLYVFFAMGEGYFPLSMHPEESLIDQTCMRIPYRPLYTTVYLYRAAISGVLYY